MVEIIPYRTPGVDDPLQARTGITQSFVDRLFIHVADCFGPTSDEPQLNAFAACHRTLINIVHISSFE